MGGGGKGGECERGKKLLLLPPSPLLKNLFFSRSLFSLDRISKSLMSGALSKNLLKSFCLPISASFIKEPITGFCASKCFTSLNKSSIGFLFLIMFFEIGSSLLLKLASFNLLLVTYRSSSPCISSPKLLVADRNFFTSSLRGSLTSCYWKSVFWEKSIPLSQSL